MFLFPCHCPWLFAKVSVIPLSGSHLSGSVSASVSSFLPSILVFLKTIGQPTWSYLYSLARQGHVLLSFSSFCLIFSPQVFLFSLSCFQNVASCSSVVSEGFAIGSIPKALYPRHWFLSVPRPHSPAVCPLPMPLAFHAWPYTASPLWLGSALRYFSNTCHFLLIWLFSLTHSLHRLFFLHH